MSSASNRVYALKLTKRKINVSGKKKKILARSGAQPN